MQKHKQKEIQKTIESKEQALKPTQKETLPSGITNYVDG